MTQLKCEHGRRPSACSPCVRKPNPLFPDEVWVTKGDAFHRSPNCEGIIDYQNLNTNQGRETHPPRLVPQWEAWNLKRTMHPCNYCFPQDG